MDRYGHLFLAQDEVLAEALDGTLRRQNPSSRDHDALICAFSLSAAQHP